MIPSLIAMPQPVPVVSETEPHVLVVARDAATRFALANRLLDAGLRITASPAFGVTEILCGAADTFDLMLLAQSAEETTMVGLAQLVRSVDEDLPLVVLDLDTVEGDGVLELVDAALARWPLRERQRAAVH